MLRKNGCLVCFLYHISVAYICPIQNECVMKFKAVAIFCGSKAGADPVFTAHAAELGDLLGKHGLTLIYGGGNKGLMGDAANACMAAGGKVVGIIPEVLVEWEHQHEGITELVVVPDMHSRKKMLYELCDAAVVLPGGFGTLDELFEMLTWNQLSIHNKEIFLLNSNGFYNHLIGHLQQMQNQHFLYEAPGSRITVLKEPAELFH